jgi:hypothetical protein
VQEHCIEEIWPAAARRSLEKNPALAEDLGMQVRLDEATERAPATAAAVREEPRHADRDELCAQVRLALTARAIPH